MTLEGPILPLQSTSISSSHSSFHVHLDPQVTCSPSAKVTNSAEMSHLDVTSMAISNSASIGDSRSAPNSPPHHQSSLNKDATHSLSPNTYVRSNPRSTRSSSGVPNPVSLHSSLNLTGLAKGSFSSRFMRRAPTIDTSDITKEEFEDYTKVNQYKVLDIIGHGSYGIVRKATDNNDEVFAMKILNKKKLLRKGFVGRMRPGMKPRSNPRENMEREIAILKKLDHPNVVHLFEVLDDPQEIDLILVLEYVQKGPVIDQLPMDTAFSEDKSREYFIDLILGLEYLHSQNVIHRDIKPQNLLLDVNNTIKIADFGVSEQIDRSEANISRWAGTPAFVAPETLSSSNVYKGQGVDIWASGVTLFCFVFGKVPWSPPSIPELYEMIRSNEVPIPEDVPISAELQDVLLKLLVKDPDKRATISEIRVHPWVNKSPRFIPSKEENCNETIDVSEEDIQKAIKPFYTPIHILLMIKQMAKRRSLRNPKSYSVSESPSPAASPCTSPRHIPLEEKDTNDLSEPSKTTSRNKREKFATSRNAPTIFVDNERLDLN